MKITTTITTTIELSKINLNKLKQEYDILFPIKETETEEEKDNFNCFKMIHDLIYNIILDI